VISSRVTGSYDIAVFRWLYPAWIAVCAVLFLALGGLEDPSRPRGRILSIEAGTRALEIARARGLDGYEVVHVARARAGEGAAEHRWIVLLDRVPHTRLAEAVVVELRVEDGTLLRVRKPA
jgi:hypothetical protein